jgi:2-phospho-L-lactate guanylyltransferase (CobY/MobA/RfbA family)
LSSADVDRIVDLGKCKEQTVVLSPSYDGGTNALFQNPPNLIRASFGPKSFAKHVKEAQSKGFCVRVYYSTGVVKDIDSAEDLDELMKTENSTVCQRILSNFNLNGNGA